jgi:hypothetical protein
VKRIHGIVENEVGGEGKSSEGIVKNEGAMKVKAVNINHRVVKNRIG